MNEYNPNRGEAWNYGGDKMAGIKKCEHCAWWYARNKYEE